MEQWIEERIDDLRAQFADEYDGLFMEYCYAQWQGWKDSKSTDN